MRFSSRALWWGGWLAVIVLSRAALGPADRLSAQDVPSQVLVVYSTRLDTQLPIVGERELPRLLGQGLAGRLDYYTEYIDVVRFPDPEYQAALRDFFQRKYGSIRLDLVIAVQNVAFQFVAANRDQLFPGVPVVFSSADRDARRPANATGIIAEVNLVPTLTLAVTLQPDIEQVFVVTGASSRDEVYETLARTQLKPFERRIAFTYLAGLRARDLEQRIASLPRQSIVYYLLFYQDGAGENVHPLEYLDHLADVANRPIYSWVDSTIGRGIVGGSLQNQTALLNALGGLALRLLHGERADSIPVLTADLSVDQVDWRQLHRWSIDETRVPAGTRVLFREPSSWSRYRVSVLSGVALLLVAAALIGGLLVQTARRRSAEEQARVNHAQLRLSDGRIRELGRRLFSAQESERARIARELHDDIGQQMAILRLDLQRFSASEPTQAGDADSLLRDAMDRADSVAKGVHDLSHRLHPAKLRLIGLVAALNRLDEGSYSGTEITVSHENIPPTLPQDLSLCLYRTAQEAVHNAVKHGSARHVSLHLVGNPAGIRLTIVDDGLGFDLEAAHEEGLGLISMNERVEQLGGTLTIQSAPGLGTRVEAMVPFQTARSD